MALLTLFALGIVKFDLPYNYEEAIKHPEEDKWIEAMKTELNDLRIRGVNELVPPGVRNDPIPCLWVFYRNTNNKGDMLRCITRLVANVFKQKFGIDFLEIFAPVVCSTTVRIIFALVT